MANQMRVNRRGAEIAEKKKQSYSECGFETGRLLRGLCASAVSPFQLLLGEFVDRFDGLIAGGGDGLGGGTGVKIRQMRDGAI